MVEEAGRRDSEGRGRWRGSINAKRQLKDWRRGSAVTEILGKLKYIESRGKLQ